MWRVIVPVFQNWVREELITGRIHLASQVTADSDPPRLALVGGSWQQLAKGRPTPAQSGSAAFVWIIRGGLGQIQGDDNASDTGKLVVA